MTPEPQKQISKNGLAFSALAQWLIFLAFLSRISCLGNTPGLNGDEAFFGTDAVQFVRHQPILWHTPSGNLVDIFYLLPSIILSMFYSPSVVLLRTPAVISGVLAIFAALWFGRKVLGLNAGLAFGLLIAVLPEDIAQSRFGWEPSQSVLATIIALYCSLMIVKQPEKSKKWIVWTCIAIACSVLCHPTNIFISVFLIGAILIRYWASVAPFLNPKISGAKAIAAWVLVVSIVVAGAYWRTHSTASAITVTYTANSTLAFFVFFARLFDGITCLRYIAGSWMPGTVPTIAIQSLDAVTLLIIFGSIICGVIKSSKSNSTLASSDRLLMLGWVALFIGFYLAAGAGALTPGNERYGLVLIAPTLAAVCRSLDLTVGSSKPLRAALAVTTLVVSCAALVMFYQGYFLHFDKTAGTSHEAFLTGPVEPKLAAWLEIQAENTDPNSAGFVISSTWWNASPISYFALGDQNNKLYVLQANQLHSQEAQTAISQALPMGRVWYVEFAGSPQLAGLESDLKSGGMGYTEKTIFGYANVPIDVVVHVTGLKKR